MSVPGLLRYKSLGVQEGSKEDRDGCLTPQQAWFSQASGVSSHLVLGMLGIQATRAKDQGEGQMSILRGEVSSYCGPCWSWVGNMGLLCGAEG